MLLEDPTHSRLTFGRVEFTDNCRVMESQKAFATSQNLDFRSLYIAFQEIGYWVVSTEVIERSRANRNSTMDFPGFNNPSNPAIRGN